MSVKKQTSSSCCLHGPLSFWPTLTSILRPDRWEAVIIQLSIMLSISSLTQAFYSFSTVPSFSWSALLSFSCSLLFFPRLCLSCRPSHLNPAHRGPDRDDWFPVRRCLERILELSGRVHPPLLHSNPEGQPCVRLWLSCMHTWSSTQTRVHIQRLLEI